MRKLPFKSSERITLGVELEFQLIDPNSFDLIGRASDLLHLIKHSEFNKSIKPEITQSMIEVNSSVHLKAGDLYKELRKIQLFLEEEAEELNVLFAGGGTHPFQKWSVRKIFPSKRFKKLSQQFRYLSKRSTVFGQHVHVGVKSADDALYLTHALGRYVPQFIAINASSPFLDGVDTGFQCTRLNTFTSFPFSGIIPWLMTWKEFSDYFYQMRKLKLLKTMKDVYWDVRPKPEFGTVEIRVCDTPLTLEDAVIIAAYIQTLSKNLLHKKDMVINKDFYHLYNYNRFQACRYGFDGHFINPINLAKHSIREDIIRTLEEIKSFAEDKTTSDLLHLLKAKVSQNQNGTFILKNCYRQSKSVEEVVRTQCKLWSQKSAHL